MTSITWLDCPTIIPYYGGKNKISKELVPLLPEHSRYIEVFAGGLSMFFRKPKADFTIVNDADNDIVNLYMCVVNKYDELIQQIYWVPKSRTLFSSFKGVVRDNKEIDIPDPKRADQYFYVIRNSFNKNPNNPFSSTSYWKVDEIIKNLKYSRDLIADIAIENMDFRKLIERYHPEETDMWYFDPPYIIATEKGNYYMEKFGAQEHEDLRNYIDFIDRAGAKFMISYDDRNIIREMYSDYNVDTIFTKYSVNVSDPGKVVTELVITNYDHRSQGELF